MSVQERHRREREARRQAILAAAARVFAHHGLEGATIQMVAREAELAVGTIYLYFASRDDLYLCLLVERTESLRSRCREIQFRGLTALDELRAILGAYLDQSREVFSSQQSMSYAQLQRRLRRPSEIRNFHRVIDLSHEIFGLWARTIRRAFDAGLIVNPMGPTRTAAVMWASLRGAFRLMGEENFFREVTGLNPEHFVEEALESLLAIGSAAAAARGVDQADRASVEREHRPVGAVQNGHGKNKVRQTEKSAARVSAG